MHGAAALHDCCSATPACAATPSATVGQRVQHPIWSVCSQQLHGPLGTVRDRTGPSLQPAPCRCRSGQWPVTRPEAAAPPLRCCPAPPHAWQTRLAAPHPGNAPTQVTAAQDSCPLRKLQLPRLHPRPQNPLLPLHVQVTDPTQARQRSGASIHLQRPPPTGAPRVSPSAPSCAILNRQSTCMHAPVRALHP